MLALPGLAKIINAGWNEGNVKWRALSRNPEVLAQSVTPIDTGTGLLNTDCSAMQVLVFTRDHQGTTIAHIVQDGLHRMYGTDDSLTDDQRNVIYYLTVYNEPMVQPAEPENVDREGILRGLYLYSEGSTDGLPEGAPPR